jgi:hypothetical protein
MKSTLLIFTCFYALSTTESVYPQKAKVFQAGVDCSVDGSSYSIVATVSNGLRKVTTSGCPDYDWTGQTTPNEAAIEDEVYVFPIEPTVCVEPTAFVGVYKDLAKTIPNGSPVMSSIGVSYDGVALFSNSDDNSNDAFLYEAYTFDSCNGHVDHQGIYHYHSQVPDSCLLTVPMPNAHSDLFGFMADGIPVYGPYGDDGLVPTDLDECNGHTDDSFPFYHYHVAHGYQYPYIVNCLKGKLDTSLWPNFKVVSSCVAATTQYDYSSLNGVWGTQAGGVIVSGTTTPSSPGSSPVSPPGNTPASSPGNSPASPPGNSPPSPPGNFPPRPPTTPHNQAGGSFRCHLRGRLVNCNQVH